MVLWCAMFLVRGCALVGSLAIQTYSLSRLSFAIKIISVNGSKSVGPVVQKCRSTWQDLFNRYACACFIMSNGPQDPLGTERWVIMSTKGTSSACSADKLATSERTRRAATNHGPSQERARCSGLWKREGNEHVYVRYEHFFLFFLFFFFSAFNFHFSISIFNFQFSISISIIISILQFQFPRRTRSRFGREQDILCDRVTRILLD